MSVHVKTSQGPQITLGPQGVNTGILGIKKKLHKSTVFFAHVCKNVGVALFIDSHSIVDHLSKLIICNCFLLVKCNVFSLAKSYKIQLIFVSQLNVFISVLSAYVVCICLFTF